MVGCYVRATGDGGVLCEGNNRRKMPMRCSRRRRIISQRGSYAAALSSLAARAIQRLTPAIIRVTTVMVMVASTLISGLTPRRTFENTTMGKVLLPGPDVKLEITRSSHDRVKASSHPDKMAGKMMGSVMTKNTLSGRAPQIHRGFLERGVESRQTRVHDHRDIGIENVMCPMVMVVMPRPAGHPINCSRATNSSSSDSPVMTSGMTSGAVVMALRVKRPLNCLKRANPIRPAYRGSPNPRR